MKKKLVKILAALLSFVTFLNLGVSIDDLNGVSLQVGNKVYAEVANAADMPEALFSHAQSTLADGRVMVTGGCTIRPDYYRSYVWIYTPSTNTWAAAADMPYGRSKHGQSTLQDGRVLITGGELNDRPLNSALIYNPSTNTWTSVAAPYPVW